MDRKLCEKEGGRRGWAGVIKGVKRIPWIYYGWGRNTHSIMRKKFEEIEDMFLRILKLGEGRIVLTLFLPWTCIH